MKKNVYICSTPYHVLIAIIKQLKSNCSADLILSNTSIIGTYCVEQLKKNTLFDHVTTHYCIDKKGFHLSWKQKIFMGSKKSYEYLHRLANLDYNYFEDKEVFIFYDGDFFGYLLNICRIRYHLIEDGLNCFQHSHALSFKNIHKFPYSLIEKIIGLYWNFYGKSKYTIDVEVNKIENVSLNLPLIECPRHELFSALNDEERRRIINIFIDNKEKDIEKTTNATLLITQPLFEDGILSHERKIRLYKFLVKEYATNKLVIKPHPREKENYQKIFPNAIIVKNNFVPIEVLEMQNKMQFVKAITAFSTSIESLCSVKEKIRMGATWTKNFN